MDRSDDSWPGQLFHQGAIYNNVDLLKCLLQGEEKANIDAQDMCGRTALYTAVSNGSLECIEILLSHGADANKAAGIRCHNMTPLHEAVLDSKLDALAKLIAHGADLSLEDVSGKTPLALAKYMKNKQAVYMIEKAEDNGRRIVERLYTALCEACAEGSLTSVETVLAKSGQHKKRVINLTSKGLSPISIAAKCGHADVLVRLLEEGATCSPQKDTGLTILHLACESGNIHIMEILLQRYPDLVSVRSVDHQLPLHSAVTRNQIEAVRLLLQFQFPRNQWYTFADPETNQIYKSGLQINAQDASGETALHISCRNNFLEICKLLLSYSVQIEVESPLTRSFTLTSKSCFQLNKSEDDEDIFQLNKNHFVSWDRGLNTVCEDSVTDPNQKHYKNIYPVDVNILSSEGLSPLHLGIRHRHKEIVELLLESRKSHPNTMTVKDKEVSVLLYAYEYLDLFVLELLLKHGLTDVDNKVLNMVFFSQNEEAKWLLLTYKSCRDSTHSINKTEMRKLAFQQSRTPPDNVERVNSADMDYRKRFPSTPVSITWESLNTLQNMDSFCLLKSCFLHNPYLLKSVSSTVTLCAITKVDISKNSFDTFPVIILELVSLVLLKASRNQISEIPDDCRVSCISLEEIHLNENKIKVLPKFLFQLPVLKYLDVSFNRISEMPSDMWASLSLVTLKLSGNSLSWLPILSREHAFQRQGSRRQSRNSLTSLQKESTASLSSSIGSVDVETFQFDIGSENMEFTILSLQDVTNNQLARVNKWSSGIKVVDRDPWKGSSQVSGIRQLCLSRNKFTSVPPCLSCCAPNLEVLNLSDNPLTTVGLISDYPANLVELDLSRTGLLAVDKWKQQTDFKTDNLMCYGFYQILPANKFSSVSISNSPVFGLRGQDRSASPNLRKISPAPPRDSPCPHRQHVSLNKLEKLNLSGNKLSSFYLARNPLKDNQKADAMSICSMESEEIQSRLLFPILSELNLNGNQLTSLPSDIGEQTALKILSLGRNLTLKELPPKLGLLKNLWKLDLEFCPLDGAIQDFVQRSRFPVKDILGFLQSVLEESTEYNRMNLMLVGFHRIGKTSLLQKISEKGKLAPKNTHWRERVNRGEVRKSNTLLSTVGIDINELILEKKTHGQVVFRTWDFGGQKEYYATHQYFLSPRSLYLVVWSIIDGERGVESLLQWLINIQARAPGASVIIVGTHLDILRDKVTKRNFPEDFEDSMMSLIDKMFLRNQEPDKSGLPNILRAVNVSCKTGDNIRHLVDLLYESAFQLRHPKSRTQLLLRQKIPRKYLLLQTIVQELAMERMKFNKEPVLTKSKYTLCVQNKMMEHGVTFRDVEELEQATRFLHENGVLFHYDDLPLRDLFFLDPQWLCDQLAKVITVKEINNFAQRGVMKLDSLEFLFKSPTFQPEHIKAYITSLLNKFEVALQFDQEHLLLPSLLPTETELLEMARRKSDVRIPLRRPTSASVVLPRLSKRRASTEQVRRSGRRLVEGPPRALHVGSSVFYTGSQAVKESVSLHSLKDIEKQLLLLAIKPTSNPIFSCCRLYFLTYFPSGFWPRLITRVLADSSLYPIVQQLFQIPPELLRGSAEVKTLADKEPEWRCWQTGFELFYLGFEMLRIREVVFSTSSYFCDYSQCRIKCSIDNEWSFLDVLNSKILEITFPTDSLRFHVTNKDGPPLQNLDLSKPSAVVYRQEVATTKLLVKLVEHVDNLLQDWYPDLGEVRFIQNCEGRYLVTRVVPCPQCLYKEVKRQRKYQQDNNAWFFLNPSVPDMCMPIVVNEDKDASRRDRSLTESESVRTSSQHRQVAHMREEMAASRPRTLTEGQMFIYNRDNPEGENLIFSWLIERCMLDVLENVDAVCPMHGSISPLYLLGTDGINHQLFIAPDVVFQDQSHDLHLLSSGQLDIGQKLGRGNFGEVCEGCLHQRDNEPTEKVAVKILFKQALTKKDIVMQGFQNLLEQACNAYLTARQEVSILSQIDHPHIVPLVGLCLQPLSLILMLAPQGSLDAKLKQLNTQAATLPMYVTKRILVQVSKAISYLHAHNIIYRDLKSENVLVWEFPNPDTDPLGQVEVKLADYGISRSVLPSGARGFGGTPPFIAPEILQHGGKGTYTEKVDVFSFGMFMFEILTCRMPFVDVNNPTNLVCQGERPSLTVQEAEKCPSYVLDIMSLCWSHDPDDRPTMEAIHEITKSPQFCHLTDVLTLGIDLSIYSGCSLSFTSANFDASQSMSSPDQLSPAVLSSSSPPSQQLSQIWLSSGFHGNHSLEIFTFNTANRVETHKTLNLNGSAVVAMCTFDNFVVCANADGLLHLYNSETLNLDKTLQLALTSPNIILDVHAVVEENCLLVVTSEGLVFEVQIPLSDMMMKAAETHQVENCYCSALIQTKNRCELWLGQSHGAISSWNVRERCMEFCLTHGPKLSASSSSVAFLTTLDGSSVSGECRSVWSYNYPGSTICLWDVHKRTITERLDCSHIVSTVDSPVIATSENFECGQVSALSAIDKFLYIGTTRGSVLVTEAYSLLPLCVFQCHAAREFYVKLILPVLPLTSDMSAGSSAHDEDEGLNTEVPAIVTVGRGYSNIIKTFHPNLYSSPLHKMDDVAVRTELTGTLDPYDNHTVLLSWSAQHWHNY